MHHGSLSSPIFRPASAPIFQAGARQLFSFVIKVALVHISQKEPQPFGAREELHGGLVERRQIAQPFAVAPKPHECPARTIDEPELWRPARVERHENVTPDKVVAEKIRPMQARRNLRELSRSFFSLLSRRSAPKEINQCL